MHLTSPLREFPLEFREKFGPQKTRIMGLQVDDRLSRFDTISACDRRTDVQPIAITCAVILMHVKTVKVHRFV